MTSELSALASTALGALIGLAAPLISLSRGDRDNRRERQREVARDIMALFEDMSPTFAEFTAVTSRPRMRLYLMALRLEDAAPREACLAFVAGAGESGAAHADLAQAWDRMMTHVGAVYRLGGRGNG